MHKKVYLDAAATTYLKSEVLQEMLPMFDTNYGNSSSLHKIGRDAVAVVDEARDKIAKAIGSDDGEIYFTSGGTEANNWAIRGLAYANKHKGNHIITTKIEHPSVLESFRALEREGFEVTYLDVDNTGLIKFADLLRYLKEGTILVSIMIANNEVGTIQHLNAISKTVKEKGAIFHTDAVQAMGAIKINVDDLGIDAMTISAHKLYGPKGIGALFLRKGVKIDSLLKGGSQEKGKRAGTVNTPAVAGFGKAVELAVRDMDVNSKKLINLKNYFYNQVILKIDDVHFNGHKTQNVPHIINLSFEGIEGESILALLDMRGVSVSTGSACSSASLQKSHVLGAMGVDVLVAQGAVRFSFPISITKSDLDYVVDQLAEVVEKLREISPIKNKNKSKKRKK